MTKYFRAASIAALPLAGLAAFAGLTGTPAVTASDLPDRLEADLLPQSVIDAAIAEETALPQTVEAPRLTPLSISTPASALVNPLRVKASSLQTLVSRYSATPLSGKVNALQVLCISNRRASHLPANWLLPKSFSTAPSPAVFRPRFAG
jgi:hypothetical protein